ncbi:MAG: ribosome biogenesis GTPase Der, partial [Bacteriovoracaceae bacterium]|nr:ribosome biogenesis GTPase Der [Bacteriovoracaceae bacterium]
DTGGFYPEKLIETKSKNKKENLDNDAPPLNMTDLFNVMTTQGKLAVQESDLVLLVMDIREGLSPFDEQIVKFLRQEKKDFRILLNKSDTESQESLDSDFFKLGFSEDLFFKISAAHGRGVGELRRELQRFILDFQQKNKESQESKVQHIPVLPQHEVLGTFAILGAPNVGKSTFLNWLLGSERSLVSPMAGTTVDPVTGYVTFEIGDPKLKGTYSLRLIDTAGIRKKSVVTDELELQSVYRALKTMEEADIILYLADATKGMTHQDRRLCEMILEKGRSVIIIFNKTDLMSETLRDSKKKKEWLLDLKEQIPWDFCKPILLSAKHKQGLKELQNSIVKTLLSRKVNIGTSQMNMALTEIVEKHPLTFKGQTQFKVKYASMIRSAPPTILLFTNRSKDIPEHYRRYLLNGLRSFFDLENTPIHLIFRTNSDKDKDKEKTKPKRKIK